MSAYRKSVTKHCPIRAAAHILLLLTLLWAFLGTVDGPTVNLSSNAGGIVYSKGSSFDKLEHGAQPGLALIGVFQEEPPVIPASFLLFDCKQNLRMWPVLAGDKSRSPPLVHVL